MNITRFEPSGVLDARTVSLGVISLLRDCVGAVAGESVLFVSEIPGSAYYDDAISRVAAGTALSMGMDVYEVTSPHHMASDQEVTTFVSGITGYDHVVFFSRIGDRIRFAPEHGLHSATMCYTLEQEMLDSAFGSACHFGLCDVKKSVDRALQEATEIEVTCPRGTHLVGRVHNTDGTQGMDVTLKRFPMLVPQPVSASGFSGQVVLSRFLTGTGSRFYEPYSLHLESDVTVEVAGNRIGEIRGAPTDVSAVRKHYLSVASYFNIDPWFIHSWHAGIHPGCSFSTSAVDDIVRWSGSAFGNPRVLHFHTCGEYAPGEISWNIIDPTIRIDGVALWENGALHADRLPNSSALFDGHANLAALYHEPSREIGW